MKLASLLLVLSGFLLIADSGLAQDAPPPAAGETTSAGPEAYTAPASAPAASDGGSGGGGNIKDTGPHQRPMMASAQLYTPWRFGFGVGLKLGFEIPLVHNGFIPQINNSFSIEPNFGFAWNTYNRGYGYRGYGYYNGIDDEVSAMEYTPGVSVLWSFYFSPQFRAYAAIHTGVTVVAPYYTGPGDFEIDDTRVRFHGELAPGIVYSLSDKFALRAELGWWSGAKFGFAMML